MKSKTFSPCAKKGDVSTGIKLLQRGLFKWKFKKYKKLVCAQRSHLCTKDLFWYYPRTTLKAATGRREK